MYYIMFDDEKTLILSEATKAEVNEDKGYVKFFDGYGNMISLFRLCEIKGFYESN